VDIHAKIEYKGVIVLGTVYQDVHSIGKDLAKTLFENYGYRVIDLGVMTPLQKYIDTAKEYNADAIGMSALLVQTSNHMITVAR
jgi:5-methyltetrahydrofolate--homocysteine methyltransferase